MSWTITVPSVAAADAADALSTAVQGQLDDVPAFVGGPEETLMRDAAAAGTRLAGSVHAEYVSIILEGRDGMAANVRIAAAPAPIPLPQPALPAAV